METDEKPEPEVEQVIIWRPFKEMGTRTKRRFLIVLGFTLWLTALIAGAWFTR